MKISKTSLVLPLGTLIVGLLVNFYVSGNILLGHGNLLALFFGQFVSPIILIILLVRFFVYKERNVYLYSAFILNLLIIILTVYAVYQAYNNIYFGF